MLMDDKIFHIRRKEWILTGRTATKPIFHKVNVNRKMGTMTIIEIAPQRSRWQRSHVSQVGRPQRTLLRRRDGHRRH